MRKLRGEYRGENSRHERPLARPTKKKIGDDEDEGPTYVQEDSQETISRIEYDALVNGLKVKDQERQLSASRATSNDNLEEPLLEMVKPNQDQAPSKQQLARVGAIRKRRFAKVVGKDDDAEGSPHNTDWPVGRKRLKLKKGERKKLSFNDESTEKVISDLM